VLRGEDGLREEPSGIRSGAERRAGSRYSQITSRQSRCESHRNPLPPPRGRHCRIPSVSFGFPERDPRGKLNRFSWGTRAKRAFLLLHHDARSLHRNQKYFHERQPAPRRLLLQPCHRAQREPAPAHNLSGEGKRRTRAPARCWFRCGPTNRPPLSPQRVLVPHLEADEGDLHGEDGSQAVNSAVGDVDPVGEAAGQHQHQNVQGDEVDQEDVAAPRGDLPREKTNKQNKPPPPKKFRD